MKTHLPPSSRTIVGLSAATLLLVSMQAQAACGNGVPTITNVPSLGGSLYRVKALNSTGQVAGYSYISDDLEVHAFRFGPSGLTDLGTLGGTSGQGFAMNNSGQVVGESTITDDLATRAFMSTSGPLLDLGTLGGNYSTAAAINDAGQVTGNSQTPGEFSLEAFRYSNGSLSSLGSLGGGYSTAAAINQAGNVVGTSLTDLSEFHAYLYGAGMVDLGTFGGGYSAAFALNDSDVVVGESLLANGEIHGFVYSGGVMTDVGTLGGTYSRAYAINNAGQVIGVAATAGDAQYNGFVYSGTMITDLGTLGGSYSTPYAINNLGQVVGESETAEFVMRAFLWQNGNMIDLNTLLPTNSGWELNSAQFINNAGRIVGLGIFDGESQWFILDLGGDNHPPIANAGADQTVQCSGQVTLDGTLSNDPDGDALTYQWSEGANILGTTPTLTASFGAGTHTITLTVSDPCGESSQDVVVVEVSDTIPPTLSCPGVINTSGEKQVVVPDLRPLITVSDNCTPVDALVITQSPVAGTLLGSGQYVITVTAQDVAGNTATCTTTVMVGDSTRPVIIRAPKSETVGIGRDCQGKVPDLRRQVVAKDNCTPARLLVVTQSPAVGTLLPKGEHLVTLTVTDEAGNSTSKHVSLRVVDRTAPRIHSVTATPSVISATDGKYVSINVSVVATDNCDSTSTSKIVSILCDEHTSSGDIKITDDLSARLATSRNARTYKIIIRCRDDSGNIAYDTVTVRVTKSKGGRG